MAIKRTTGCRRVHAALRLLIRDDGPRVNRDLLLHSLPDPLPTEKDDIIDILLQLVLMLFEEFKPDDNGDNGNHHTLFPNLAVQTADMADAHVAAAILKRDAPILSNTIALTVQELIAHAPRSLRLAREQIRLNNEAALQPDAHYWHNWNTAIREILDGHADAGRLATIANYLDAWTQISKGLDQLK